MLRQIFPFFLRSSGLRQSVITIVGNTLATGLSAVSLILISRILGPADFGIFTVGFAIVILLSKVIDGGLISTVLKFAGSSTTDEERNAYFSVTFKFKLLVTLVVVVVGLIFTPQLAQFLNFSNVAIIRLSFLLVPGTIFYEQLQTMLQALHQFSKAVALNALQASTKLIGMLLFLLFSIKSNVGIFSFYIAAPFTSLLVAKYLLPHSVKLNIFGSYPSAQAKILRMVRHTSIAVLAAGIIENIDVLFVQKYLNVYETGLFGGVSRIAMIFMLIAYSMATVLNPRVAKYTTKFHLGAYLRKAFLIVGVSLLGFLSVIPLAKWLIVLTIGQAYISATPVLLILLASSFLTIAVVPFIALFYSYNQHWYFSVSGLLQLLIVVAGNFIFVPIYGLEAAAWTRLASRTFLFMFTVTLGLYYYYKLYGKNAQATA